MATTRIPGQIILSGSIPATALGGGVVSSSIQIAASVPAGTVSSSAQYPGWVTASAQVDYNSITNKLSGVVSSSAQVAPLLPASTVSASTQFKTLTDPFSGSFSGSLTGTFPYGSLTSIPANIFSSSVQLPAGTVSSSAQVDYNSITNKLSGVVSSSAQVAPLLPGGTVSSSAQLPAGTVSASAQVLLNGVTGTTFANAAFTFPSDLTVSGNLTAKQIYTVNVSSSVIYQSGSTKFGDTTDDVMSVTGSIAVLGGTISGSMVGMFSGSSQVDYNSITNKLSGVVSSSAQVSPLLPGGSVSSSAQVIAGVAAQTIVPSIINATGAISGASIQTSGAVTSTASAGLVVQPATTTAQALFTAVNTGGTLYIGLDNSAGNYLGTGGAYGTGIYRPAATTFAISRTSNVDLLISATGAVSMAGTLAVTGAATFSSTLAITGAFTGATTGAFSGKITSTVGNNAMYFESVSATTGYHYTQIKNTGAWMIFGIEGSTPSSLATNDTAYSTVLVTQNATDLILGTNQTMNLKIASGGAATFSSSLTITGALTGATTGAFSAKITQTLASGSGRNLDVFTTASTASDYAIIGMRTGSLSLWQMLVNSAEDFRIGISGVGDFLTLSKTGAATFSSTLAITGALTGVTTGAFSGLVTLTGGAVYINSTNSDSAMTGSYIRFGTNLGIQSNAANSALLFKTFNGASFIDALSIATSGAATFSNSLAVTGAATLSSTLAVTGLSAFGTSTDSARVASRINDGANPGGSQIGITAKANFWATSDGWINGSPQISFGASGTTYAPAAIGMIATSQTGNTYGDLVFATRSVTTDTQPTERLRIASTGAATFSSTVQGASTISVGAATPSNSGAGITFPATQSASSNVNTLDDYEEGSWTATITCGTSGTITLGSYSLTYTKIGKLVHVEGFFQVASVSSPQGGITIGGLPFQAKAEYSAVSLRMDTMVGAPVGVYQAYVGTNSSTIVLELYSLGNASGDVASTFGTNSTIILSATYEASQ